MRKGTKVIPPANESAVCGRASFLSFLVFPSLFFQQDFSRSFRCEAAGWGGSAAPSHPLAPPSPGAALSLSPVAPRSAAPRAA